MANYDWKNFLDFSSWLIGYSGTTKPDDETISRVAISRAYYAAFHVAEDYLERTEHDEVLTGADHEKVCMTFKNMNKGNTKYNSTCQLIGNVLTMLKTKRRICDYKSNYTVTLKEAKYTFKKAEMIIKEITQL